MDYRQYSVFSRLIDLFDDTLSLTTFMALHIEISSDSNTAMLVVIRNLKNPWIL